MSASRKEGKTGMKFTLRPLLIVGGLLLGLALPASADAYYAATEGAVALRAGPGAQFKRLAVIPRGASIWVDFCQPRWCKATWRGITGWVSAAFVTGRYAEPREPYPNYGLFDDYYFYPHRHHRHHRHHCDDSDKCKPWEHKPPKWTKPWDGPKKDWDGPKKHWDGPKTSWDGPKKDWDGPKMWKQDDGPKSFDGPKFDGPRFRDNNDTPNFDNNDRGNRGDRKWDKD
jgi:uncharacterized protein YraI